MLADDEVAEIEAKVAGEIDQAVGFAERGSWEPLEDLTKDVYTPAAGPTPAAVGAKTSASLTAERAAVAP